MPEFIKCTVLSLSLHNISVYAPTEELHICFPFAAHGHVVQKSANVQSREAPLRQRETESVMAALAHHHSSVPSLMADSQTTSYKICLPCSLFFEHKNCMLNVHSILCSLTIPDWHVFKQMVPLHSVQQRFLHQFTFQLMQWDISINLEESE